MYRVWSSDYNIKFPLVVMHCAPVRGQAQYYPDRTTAIFSRCRLLRHFHLYKKQIPLERIDIGRHWGNPSEFDESTAESHKIKRILDMFPSMETTFDKVCGIRRRQLHQRLHAMICNCSFSFTATVPTLFDQSLYIYFCQYGSNTKDRINLLKDY